MGEIDPYIREIYTELDRVIEVIRVDQPDDLSDDAHDWLANLRDELQEIMDTAYVALQIIEKE